ncbi:helix-turn-helix domain-containing protein [Actinocorallia longicatena]|uniref:Helix-turn-helix domain-containing protein n=1 Tax=Actinocorallia longicatena TaxID=111803 RepID=A0ABP6QL02_9ACTN
MTGRPIPPARAFTVEQTAQILGVGRDTVYGLLRTGQLRSIKIGRLRRITQEHITAFLTTKDNDSDES